MTESQEKIIEILRILKEQKKAIGAKIIADELNKKGYNLGERAVRYHMQILDEKGFTHREGYSGRKITKLGKMELDKGLVYDQVDFIFSKFEEMIYQTSLNYQTKKGNVVINSSNFILNEISSQNPMKIMKKVFESGLSVSPWVDIKKLPDEKSKNHSEILIKTICGTTIDGMLLNQGIPTLPLYGGLLKIKNYVPQRFTELISYKKTSITPLDAFITDGMTSVLDVLRYGDGIIPANFRVVPSEAISKTKDLLKKLTKIGINGIISIGENGENILGVPVPDGSSGIAIVGGTTPLCAIKELGYKIDIRLSEEIAEFEQLNPIVPKFKNNTYENKILKTSDYNPNKTKKQKVPFLLSKAYNLIQNVDFNIETHEGKLIANVSYLDKKDLDEAIEIMKNSYSKSKKYINPYYKIINPTNIQNKNNSQVGIATICSLSIDGILINNGIMSTPKYGGLLELGKNPLFVELISYNGSSLDPHEIFIFKNMTSLTKNKMQKKVLASVKEVPFIARDQTKELLDKISMINLPIYKVGKPREILYNAKVDSYNFGIIAGSGLNPIAAVKEEEIDITVKSVQGTIILDEMEKFK